MTDNQTDTKLNLRRIILMKPKWRI